jgi:hypothetical protein
MKKVIKLIYIILSLPLSIVVGFTQDNPTIKYIKQLEKTYVDAKILAFDGNIKYYTNINATSPDETMLVSYRRDRDKVFIMVGDQTIVYDGVLSLVINENEKRIYVSNEKPKKNKNVLPTVMASEVIKSGFYDIKSEDYMGDKWRITLKEKDNSVASTLVFISHKQTNFIEFARMIIDKDDEELDENINKKKFEFSYYNYKMILSESDKINTEIYVTRKKNGKGYLYKGIGRFKDFEIISI